jgi:hypothetical protein
MFGKDFNDADQQLYDLIPANTIAPVVMTVRPGGKGEDGWFRESQSSDAIMLDCEFTVSAGPYARRKFWKLFVFSGGKTDESGNSIAANISRATLRAILESARGIMPTDFSEEAKKARIVSGPGDFDGLEFIAKIGVKKGQNGYADKNVLQVVITPDKKEYAEAKAGNFASPTQNPSPGGSPAWADGKKENSPPPQQAQQKPSTVPSWAQ